MNLRKKHLPMLFFVWIIAIFSGQNLLAQVDLTEKQFAKLCKKSLKGTYFDGFVSDSKIIKLCGGSLDFAGNELPYLSKTELLSEYSVEGIDRKNKTHQGTIQVLSTIAWNGGDYHSWVAYFSANDFFKSIVIKNNGIIIGTFNVNVIYGENQKLHLVDFASENLAWRMAFNFSELSLSKDGGASWISNPILRSSYGSTPLVSVLGEYSGDVLALMQGFENGSIFVRCLRFAREQK